MFHGKWLMTHHLSPRVANWASALQKEKQHKIELKRYYGIKVELSANIYFVDIYDDIKYNL